MSNGVQILIAVLVAILLVVVYFSYTKQRFNESVKIITDFFDRLTVAFTIDELKSLKEEMKGFTKSQHPNFYKDGMDQSAKDLIEVRLKNLKKDPNCYN